MDDLISWLFVLSTVASFTIAPRLEITETLSEYGYSIHLPGQIRTFFLQSINGQVAFLGLRIATSFPIRNRDPELLQRSESPRGTWLFRTVFIDRGDGKAHAIRDWWSASPDSRFVALPGEQILISGGGSLKAYDVNLHETWHLEVAASDIWQGRPYHSVLVSPSGNTIAILLDVDRETESVQVISTNGWKERGVVRIRRPANSPNDWSLSDDEIAYAAYRSGRTEVRIESFNGEDKLILSCPRYGAEFWFLGNGELATEIDPGVIVIAGKSGGYTKRMFGTERVENMVPSRSGTRVLALLVKTSVGSGWLDRLPEMVAARLAVLDGTTLSEVDSLQLDAKHDHLRGYDISPDGTSVAYLADDILDVRNVR